MNAQSGKCPLRVDPRQLATLIRAEIKKPLYQDAMNTRFKVPEDNRRFDDLLTKLDKSVEH